MKKTIAQFVDTTVYGGAEAVVVDIAAELAKRGYDAPVYHFPSPDLEHRAQSRGVELRLLEDWPAYKSWKTLPFFARRFAKRLCRENVSVLHSHLFGSSIGGGLSATFARLPHVATLHDIYTLEEHTAFRVRALQGTAFLGTYFVTVAQFLEDFLRRHAFFPRDRLRTIYNGINPDLKPTRPRAEVRAELGVAESEMLLLTVGRLVELKRQWLLVEAFARIPASTPARLVIAGDGPERRTLEALIEKLGVGERVKLIGFQTDVPSYLAACDCFALVSETECLSCSILEAMAAGLPVLATKVGGNPELIEANVTGRFVDPDPESIAKQVVLLTQSPTELRRLGENGAARLRRLFTIEKMIVSYEGLYSQR
ncbi:MAG: glycosyltransferase family 4 protein [Bdellovibrionota bacterium]